jgi:NAD(P)-dependent dehydrogenase (short-subunit alcohol dehydrogenase family)
MQRRLEREVSGGVRVNEGSLVNKLCLVTGGTAGIGLSTAKVLAERGAGVMLLGGRRRVCARGGELRWACLNKRVGDGAAELDVTRGRREVVW